MSAALYASWDGLLGSLLRGEATISKSNRGNPAPDLVVKRFEEAPDDLDGELTDALNAIRSDGFVVVTVRCGRAFDQRLRAQGVHEVQGAPGARLAVQTIARQDGPASEQELWIGVATRALEKVGPARELLARLTCRIKPPSDAVEARVAALIALECGAPNRADGLCNLLPEDLSGDVVRRIHALWSLDVAELASIARSQVQAGAAARDAIERAQRAEAELRALRGDHILNIARLTEALAMNIKPTAVRAPVAQTPAHRRVREDEPVLNDE